jgi:hypothetical protein
MLKTREFNHNQQVSSFYHMFEDLITSFFLLRYLNVTSRFVLHHVLHYFINQNLFYN